MALDDIVARTHARRCFGMSYFHHYETWWISISWFDWYTAVNGGGHGDGTGAVVG